MDFDSVFFTACFLPVTLLAVLPLRGDKARNGALLAAGILFYAFSGLSGVIFLLAAAGINYVLLRQIGRTKSRTAQIAAVVLDLALLGACKYLDSLLALFGLGSVGIGTPLGVSFITFRCISAGCDVRNGKAEAPDNFFQYLLYMSFFPQITAGPIMRWEDFRVQLTGRTVTREKTADGLCRFIAGLSKKLLLASVLARIADAVFAPGFENDVRTAWLGAVAYSLQIYFDFSGYSDMAIGLGQCFGFETKENFLHPYAAVSITDFWRRWHISLSTWFRDYLYIPLGGNRRGRGRTALNKFIVFALCGLWHGSALPYLVWGAWHGLFSALESLKLINVEKMRRTAAGRVLSRVYALAAVCIGFVFFRAPTLAAGWSIVCAMFTGFSLTSAGTVALHTVVNGYTLTALLAGCVLSVPMDGLWKKLPSAVKCTLCLALFVLCLGKMAAGGFAPFIYAGF